jgi:hypothetical protein
MIGDRPRDTSPSGQRGQTTVRSRQRDVSQEYVQIGVRVLHSDAGLATVTWSLLCEGHIAPSAMGYVSARRRVVWEVVRRGLVAPQR